MAIVDAKTKVEAGTKLESSAEVRLSLVLSPQLNARLDELAEKAHATKSDVLRKALILYDVAAEAKEKGERLALIDKDRNVLTEIVGI